MEKLRRCALRWAASMVGRHCGVKRIQQAVNSDLLITHCIIHRQHLAAKSLSTELYEVLAESIKIINFIKKKRFKQ